MHRIAQTCILVVEMLSELIDPFKRLPTEILLTIIKIEPDLQSLYCFTKVSPSAAEVFRKFASEIVEAALGRLPENLRQIIRSVARCLPGNLEPHVTGDAACYGRHETRTMMKVF